MASSRLRRAQGGVVVLAATVAVLSVVACAPARRESRITVIGVGPIQAPPPQPLTTLIDDPGLMSVVEAHITRVDPLRWHQGAILYPYSLVHLAVDREWKQSQPSDLAVRIFGGIEGNRKYVSTIQPDPVTLTTSTHVLLFVSAVTEIDPGIRASTVEDFFFIEGGQLLRFDRTPADITATDAFAALDAKGRATPSPAGS